MTATDLPNAEALAARATRAIGLARETFDIEAAAVVGLKARIGPDFGRAVALMLQVRGRVVVKL